MLLDFVAQARCLQETLVVDDHATLYHTCDKLRLCKWALFTGFATLELTVNHVSLSGAL